MNWYTVNTKPRQETLSAQSLMSLGVETFLPQFKRSKLIRGKRRAVTSALFPGYLFARFDMSTHYRAVNFSRGVRRVVSFGSAPVSIEDEMIESIKAKLIDGYAVPQASSFSPGQPVRIQEGPLRGLEAVFERPMDDQHRVILLLKALSYQAHVVVELDDVANL